MSVDLVSRAIAYREVFESEKGKLILADLIEHCGLFRNTFSGDVNTMMLNEGKRNVLLYILSILNIDLLNLLKMVEDNRKERMNGD